jgi:hypothetical protein
MSPGSVDEKTGTVAVASDKKPVKAGRFFRQKPQENINEDAKGGFDDAATKVNTPASKEATPVSVTELFRYVLVDELLSVNVLIVHCQLHYPVRVGA